MHDSLLLSHYSYIHIDVFDCCFTQLHIDSYHRQELLALRKYMDSLSVLDELRLAHILHFLCCVLFVVVLCFALSVLPVSLDCQFTIVPSVFTHNYALAVSCGYGVVVFSFLK